MNCLSSSSELREYIKSLRRAAWRLQYRTNKLYKKEVTLEGKVYIGNIPNFDDDVISQIYITDLLNAVPSKKSRYILKKIVIEGYTEKEIAEELQISQQAVNKCKRSAIKYLRENMSHFIC